MQPQVEAAYNNLHAFLFENVYKNPVAKSEEDKVDGMIKQMFEYFLHNPDKLPAECRLTLEREGAERAVADHIAGMTDRFAILVYNNLFIPRSWGY
jgi:dGTPase